jgi:hypothetical protein
MFHAKLVSYNVHIEVSIGKPIEEIVMSFYVNFYELMWPKMMKKIHIFV